MGYALQCITGMMKFDIGDGASWTANLLAIHALHDTDQRPGSRKKRQDIISLNGSLNSRCYEMRWGSSNVTSLAAYPTAWLVREGVVGNVPGIG
jgi:hypothetical protein